MPVNRGTKQRLPRLPGLPAKDLRSTFEKDIRAKRSAKQEIAADAPALEKVKTTTMIESASKPLTSTSPNSAIVKQAETIGITQVTQRTEDSAAGEGPRLVKISDPAKFLSPFLNNGKTYGTPGDGLRNGSRAQKSGHKPARYRPAATKTQKPVFSGLRSRQVAGNSSNVGKTKTNKKGTDYFDEGLTYEEFQVEQRKRDGLEALKIENELEKSMLADPSNTPIDLDEDLIVFSSNENTPAKQQLQNPSRHMIPSSPPPLTTTSLIAPQVNKIMDRKDVQNAGVGGKSHRSTSISNEQEALSTWFGIRPWEEIDNSAPLTGTRNLVAKKLHETDSAQPCSSAPTTKARRFSQSSDLIDLNY